VKVISAEHIELMQATVQARDRLKRLGLQVGDLNQRREVYNIAQLLSHGLKARVYRERGQGTGGSGEAA
jgi:hypothetical protein